MPIEKTTRIGITISSSLSNTFYPISTLNLLINNANTKQCS